MAVVAAAVVIVIIVVVVTAVAVIVALFAVVVFATTVAAFVLLHAGADLFDLATVEPYTTASGAVINLDTFAVGNNKLGFINWTYHVANNIDAS